MEQCQGTQISLFQGIVFAFVKKKVIISNWKLQCFEFQNIVSTIETYYQLITSYSRSQRAKMAIFTKCLIKVIMKEAQV